MLNTSISLTCLRVLRLQAAFIFALLYSNPVLYADDKIVHQKALTELHVSPPEWKIDVGQRVNLHWKSKDSVSKNNQPLVLIQNVVVKETNGTSTLSLLLKPKSEALISLLRPKGEFSLSKHHSMVANDRKFHLSLISKKQGGDVFSKGTLVDVYAAVNSSKATPSLIAKGAIVLESSLPLQLLVTMDQQKQIESNLEFAKLKIVKKQL